MQENKNNAVEKVENIANGNSGIEQINEQPVYQSVSNDGKVEKQKIKADGQLLHAQRLELTHPTTGARMVFHAPLPEPFKGILQKLAKQFSVDLTAFERRMED